MSSSQPYGFPQRYSDRPHSYHQQPYSQPSAPYDPPSHSQYYEPGEDLDEPFDVRADFDGNGPRWSDKYGPKNGNSEADIRGGGALGMGTGIGIGSADRRRIEGRAHLSTGAGCRVAEVRAARALSPRSIRAQGEKRTRAWREFTRDQRGMCGIRWMTRKLFVFLVFFFLAALGVTLYFVIPRAPSFMFYADSPFVVDNSTVSFNRVPTNFSFSANLNLFGDASASYLPVHFTSLQATLYDETTNKAIATGDWGNKFMEHKAQQPVALPVQFNYAAVNTSDTTWNNMYQACGHKWTGTDRPDLKFRLVLRMSIVGLVSHPEISTQISDVTCPFELPSNSV